VSYRNRDCGQSYRWWFKLRIELHMPVAELITAQQYIHHFEHDANWWTENCLPPRADLPTQYCPKLLVRALRQALRNDPRVALEGTTRTTRADSRKSSVYRYCISSPPDSDGIVPRPLAMHRNPFSRRFGRRRSWQSARISPIESPGVDYPPESGTARSTRPKVCGVTDRIFRAADLSVDLVQVDY